MLSWQNKTISLSEQLSGQCTLRLQCPAHIPVSRFACTSGAARLDIVNTATAGSRL